MATWRLVCDQALAPAWNMAVDEAMLDALAAGLVPPTLRLYRWDRPAVSVGRHQDLGRTVRVAECERLGVPIVRRPTGGRGVVHGGDQTLSVVVPVQALGLAGTSVASSYRTLTAALANALGTFGMRLKSGQDGARTGRGGDCFAVHTCADLVGAEGSKLVGSAQRRRGPVLLQQTSVRHRPCGVEPDGVFVGPAADATYPLARVEDGALAAALVEGVAEHLNVRFVEGILTAWEHERATGLLNSYAC